MQLIRPNGQSLQINEMSRNYANFDNSNQFMGLPRPPCSVSPPCQLQPLPPNGAVRAIFGPLFPSHNQPPPMNLDFGGRREGFYPPSGVYIQENNFCTPQYIPYSIQGSLPVQNMPQHYPVQGIHHLHQVQGMHNRPLQVIRAHPVQSIQQLAIPCKTQTRFPLPPMPGNNVVAITNKFGLSSAKSSTRKHSSPKSVDILNEISSQSGKLIKSEEKNIKLEHKVKKLEDKVNKSDDKVNTLGEKVDKSEDRVDILEDKVKKSEDKVGILEDKVKNSEDKVDNYEDIVSEEEENLKLSENTSENLEEDSLKIIHFEVDHQENLSTNVDKYNQRLKEFPQLPTDVHDLLHFIDENIQINIYFDAEIQLLDNLTHMNTEVHLIVTKSPELSVAWILAFVKCMTSDNQEQGTVLKYNCAINGLLVAREMNDNRSLYLESTDYKKDQSVVVRFRTHEESLRFLYVVQMFQTEMEIPPANPDVNSDHLGPHSSESSEEDPNTSGYASS